MKDKVSRRRFLQRLAVAAGGGVLAACQPKTVVVEKQVEKEVTRVVKETMKETVVVEGTPKVVEREVTKIVKETVVVEKPAAPVQAEPVTLVIMELHPAWMEWYEAVFQAAFEEKYPNIKMKAEFTSGAPQIMSKMIAMHVAGTPWDVGHWWISMGQEFQLGVKGVLKDLDPLVEADNYDLSLFFPPTIEFCRFPFGTLYSHPVHAGPGRCVVFYNKDLLDKAGVPEPTPEWRYEVEWKEALVQLKEALNPDGRIAIQNWDFASHVFTYAQLIDAWGGGILSKEGVDLFIEEEPTRSALKYIDNLYSTGTIPRPGQFTEDYRQAWMAGTAVFESAFMGDTVPHWAAAEEKGFEIGATLLPKGPGPQGRNGSFHEYHQMGIHSNSEHPQEAWEFIKFLTSEEMAESFWKDLGHQTARIADWENPELMGDYEHYPLCGELMKTMPQLPIPWNLRGSELSDAMSKGLDLAWLGDEPFETALSNTAAAMQEVIDKPMIK